MPFFKLYIGLLNRDKNKNLILTDSLSSLTSALNFSEQQRPMNFLHNKIVCKKFIGLCCSEKFKTFSCSNCWN